MVLEGAVYLASLYSIYELTKQLLGDQYPNVFFQTMREDVAGDVGVYLYTSQNDLVDIAGGDVYNCIKIQVQINSPPGEAGLKQTLEYLQSFVDKIESFDFDSDDISVVQVFHQGPKALPIGKNQFGLLVVRQVIDLKYNLLD